MSAAAKLRQSGDSPKRMPLDEGFNRQLCSFAKEMMMPLQRRYFAALPMTGVLLALALGGWNALAAQQPADPKPEIKPGPVDKDAAKEFTKTASGLKYRIRRKSDGDKPKATDTVTVHYRGWLDGGKEFDSSYKRGDPTSFPLNRVIKGWTEGLQLVGAGGMIELEIPSELAYGKRGAPPVIPADATLHFLVELIEIGEK